jgi:hypothetical protein
MWEIKRDDETFQRKEILNGLTWTMEDPLYNQYLENNCIILATYIKIFSVHLKENLILYKIMWEIKRGDRTFERKEILNRLSSTIEEPLDNRYLENNCIMLGT